MAYYNQLDDQDEQEVQQGPVITGQSSGVVGNGTGAAPDAKASAAGAAQGRSAASSAPTFAGITDYLNANKNQASKLGQQVSQGVVDTANNARQSIGDLQNTANEQIKPVSQLDSSVFNTIQTGAEQLSQEQRDQVKNVANAQYSGPQDYTQLGESYTNAAANVKKAQDAIQNTQTEEGRVNLLSQMNGGRRSQGINTFDAALLSAGEGRQALENVANQNKDLGDLFGNTTKQIQTQIGRYDDPNTPENEAAGAMGQTQQQAQATQKAIQEALANWTTSFNPKVQTAQQALIDSQNALQQDLGGTDRYALTPETMALLGLTEGTRTYGVDLNKFVQQVDPNQINASNIASADDYARYLALTDLAGQEAQILKAGNEQLAGTAPTLKYNAAELQKAIAAAKDPYVNNMWNTGAIEINDSNAADWTMRGKKVTPAYLQSRIDYMQNFVSGRKGASTTDYGAVQRRINQARADLAAYMAGIGGGSNTSIKKQG